MKAIIFMTAFAAIIVGLTICYAMPQSYQVNVQFIPALISGSCSLGQFWSPPNTTCTMCFCLTGRISRCVPQPGCSPTTNSTTTTTTTTSTTAPAPNIDLANPGASSSTVPADSSTTASTTTTTTTTKAPQTKVRRHAKFGAPFPHLEELGIGETGSTSD